MAKKKKFFKEFQKIQPELANQCSGANVLKGMIDAEKKLQEVVLELEKLAFAQNPSLKFWINPFYHNNKKLLLLLDGMARSMDVSLLPEEIANYICQQYNSDFYIDFP